MGSVRLVTQASNITNLRTHSYTTTVQMEWKMPVKRSKSKLIKCSGSIAICVSSSAPRYHAQRILIDRKLVISNCFTGHV